MENNRFDSNGFHRIDHSKRHSIRISESSTELFSNRNEIGKNVGNAFERNSRDVLDSTRRFSFQDRPFRSSSKLYEDVNVADMTKDIEMTTLTKNEDTETTQSEESSKRKENVSVRDLEHENSVLRELVMYILPQGNQNVIINGPFRKRFMKSMIVLELSSFVRHWKCTKEALIFENQELDMMIEELQIHCKDCEANTICHNFEKNVELLEHVIETTSSSVLGLKSQLKDLRKENEELLTKVRSQEIELVGMEEEIRVELKARQKLLQSFEAANRLNIELKHKNEQIEEETKRLQSQLDEAQDRVSSLERKIQETEIKPKTSVFNNFKTLIHERRHSNRNKSFLSKEIVLDQSLKNLSRTKAGEVNHEDPQEDGNVSQSSLKDALNLLEKQLKCTQQHSEILQRNLHDEERVRMNLERLLEEGERLMQTLTDACKQRIRDAKISILTTLHSEKGKVEESILKELQRTIEFLDKLKPSDLLTNKEMAALSIVDPPLDPREQRSGPLMASE